MDRNTLAFIVITVTFIFIILSIIGIWSSHIFEYFCKICVCKCSRITSIVSERSRTPNICDASTHFPTNVGDDTTVGKSIKENKGNKEG